MFQTATKFLGVSLAVLALSGAGTPANAETKNIDISASMSDEQKAVVNDMIHQFIMNNPEVLLESVELYQKRLEEEKVAESKKASEDLVNEIKSAKLDVPYAGNKDSDFLVVEFLDYNCGFCKRGYEAVAELLEKDGDNVKIAFIELPVLGQSSREAAKYALAAKMQDKYFDFHVALFKDPGPKTEANFVKIAEKLGLDTEKLKADAQSDAVKETLDRNRDVADKLGISGTPAFIVGSEFVPGYIPFSTMKTMIDSQK